MRSETQLVADATVILVLHGAIDRKRWKADHLAEAVGCTVEELASAYLRHRDGGRDALLPSWRMGEDRYDHPGEKQCEACREWLAIEAFVGARKVCEPCRG